MKIEKSQIASVVKDVYGIAPNSVKYLGGGSFGRAFKVEVDGKTLVVKAFLRDGLCEKEETELDILQKYCPVKMPEVYFVRLKREGAPVECFGMELIEGHDSFTNFALLFKPRSQKQRFAKVSSKNTSTIRQKRCGQIMTSSSVTRSKRRA